MDDTCVEKDDKCQRPIPLVWRNSLKLIVDALVAGEQPVRHSPFVKIQLDPELAKISHNNVQDYPDRLGPLCENVWRSSVHIWMGNYWQVLVDLSTIDCEISDLAFHAKIFEEDEGYTIEPGLIYVP